MMLIGSVDHLCDRAAVAGCGRELHAQRNDRRGPAPFVLWDAVKLAVAAGIFPVTWWLIGRRPDDR